MLMGRCEGVKMFFFGGGRKGREDAALFRNYGAGLVEEGLSV